MISASGRFAPPILALLAVAVIPVWVHAWSEPAFEDCRDPERLFDVGVLPNTRPNAEPAEALRLRHVGGEVLLPATEKTLQFGINHTFDQSSFWGRPVKLFPGLVLPQESYQRIDTASGGDALPIYWTVDDSLGVVRMRAYLLLHGGRPVVDTLPSSLALALDQLRSGTRPVTFFVVEGMGAPSRREELEDAARQWFEEAWLHYRSACES